MWAIARKELRELRRDRRTLAMLFLLPFLFLLVFGYAANFDVKEVRAIVVGPRAQPAALLLSQKLNLDVVATNPSDGRDQAEEALRRGEAVVAVITPERLNQGVTVLVDGSDLFCAQSALRSFAEFRAQQSVAGAGGGTSARPSLPTPTVDILFNPELRTAVIMIPGLCGIILVFVGTVATALGVVRERQAGTLEQLAIMPFRPHHVFFGKILPYLAIAAVDMIVVVAAGMLIFDVPFHGSVATFSLGAGLFLFVTLGIGVLISTVSETQAQAMQLAIMTMVPQILLSGLIFPLSSMPLAVRALSYLLPLTHFIQIARGVMTRGAPLDALWVPFTVLAFMAVGVFALSNLRFRRDLAPSGSRA